MKTIPLTKGFFTYIDDKDSPLVSKYKWFINSCRNGEKIYAKGYVNGKQVYLHRFLLGTPNGSVTDHIDGNSLNNTRGNLRVVGQNINSFNCGLKKNNTTGFRGVSFSKKSKKYESYIKVNRKKINLGYYSKIEDAVFARKKAEEKYFPNLMSAAEAKKSVIEFPNVVDGDRKRVGSSSKYRGVFSRKNSKSENTFYWYSSISFNKKHINLGSFKNEIDAAVAYINKFKEIHGYEPYKIN